MINVAVIGTGYIGPVHIEALRRISGVTVKGVTDANADLARRTAERYNIATVYGDYREVLADPSIQAIHICSPNRLHFAMNKEAIEKGKHILSEKPLAMTLAEAEELTELAEKKGIVTGIDFCYRYYPVVLEMALRVRRGDAGVVRMATGTLVPGLALVGDRLHVAARALGERRLEHRGGPGQPLVRPGAVRHGPDGERGHGGFRHDHPRAQEARAAGPGLREGDRRAAPGGEGRAGGLLASILFRLSNGAPGSFTTCQAAIGRKSDTEFQIYGSTCSYAWNHKRSNEMWIGWRDRPNETLIESPVLQDPVTAAYASLPTGHPLGYHDAVLNLFRDFYDVGQVGGKGKGRAVSRARPSAPARRKCGS